MSEAPDRPSCPRLATDDSPAPAFGNVKNLILAAEQLRGFREEYDWFKEREDGMETLSETLTKRVEGLIESHHHEKLLTTTGTRTLVCELLERNEGLELVVRELALEVERLAATIEKTHNR